MKKGKLIVLTVVIIVIFFLTLHSNPTTKFYNPSAEMAIDNRIRFLN